MKTIVVCTVLLLSISTLAFGAERIEIKGLYLGQPKSEVVARWGRALNFHGFTLAGVPGANPQISNVFIKFDASDNLSEFVFFFNEEGFDDVLSAFRSKYSGLNCEKSKVSNRMGATFTQIECGAHDDNGKFFLERFSGKIDTSIVGIMSKSAFDGIAKERAARTKDI